MFVNGQPVPIESGRSLLEFLAGEGFDVQTVVVELNGAIVPKATHASVILADADTLEIVSFVGGG